MPILTIDKQYSDGTILTEAQLDAAFSGITTLINDVGLGADNIQDNSIGPNEIQTSAVSETKLATDSVSTAKVQDGAITKTKLASAVQALLVPTGTIMAFGGTVAPTGWLMCNTATPVSRTTYADLFAVIGVSFGNGNGTTTFNIPDFRGRFLRGIDGGTGRDPNAGTRTAMNAGGNTGDNMGSIQNDAYAAHTHSYTLSNAYWNGDSGSGIAYRGADTPSANTGSSGGSETRPKNANVNYIIKT